MTVETAALWKRWKNKRRFPTASTTLGKLAESTRVSPSSHSHYCGINKNAESKICCILLFNRCCTSNLNPPHQKSPRDRNHVGVSELLDHLGVMASFCRRALVDRGFVVVAFGPSGRWLSP